MRSCSRRRRGAISPRRKASKRPRGACSTIRAPSEALDEFVSQWLRFDRILTASKDRRKYPAVHPRDGRRHDRRGARVRRRPGLERSQLHGAVHGQLRLSSDGDLARIYGVPAPAKEFERVPFPAGSERAGILGQALFLALTAKPEDSSPTARGLFVREQFLCQHVPDPPPGVNTNLPPVTEAKPQTNRDRMSEHATNPSCATCHKLIDPIGFGLEKFDAIGARRDKFTAAVLAAGAAKASGRRAPPKTVDLDIDATGYVAGHSRFAVLLARATGRGAGQERAVPGVHGEAVFPVYRGPRGDAGRSSGDPAGCSTISGSRNFASKS